MSDDDRLTFSDALEGGDRADSDLNADEAGKVFSAIDGTAEVRDGAVVPSEDAQKLAKELSEATVEKVGGIATGVERGGPDVGKER